MIPMVHVYCPAQDQSQWELLDVPLDRQDKIEWFDSLENFPSIKAKLIIDKESKIVEIFLTQKNVGWVKYDQISEYPGTSFLKK